MTAWLPCPAYNLIHEMDYAQAEKQAHGVVEQPNVVERITLIPNLIMLLYMLLLLLLHTQL